MHFVTLCIDYSTGFSSICTIVCFSSEFYLATHFSQKIHFSLHSCHFFKKLKSYFTWLPHVLIITQWFLFYMHYCVFSKCVLSSNTHLTKNTFLITLLSLIKKQKVTALGYRMFGSYHLFLFYNHYRVFSKWVLSTNTLLTNITSFITLLSRL